MGENYSGKYNAGNLPLTAVHRHLATDALRANLFFSHDNAPSRATVRIVRRWGGGWTGPVCARWRNGVR